MNERSFRIRGKLAEANPLAHRVARVRIDAGHRLIPGLARDGAADELEVDASDLTRIELDNGFVLWSRADDLVREYGRASGVRGDSQTWEFDTLAPRYDGANRGERGLLGLGIKLLDFFGVELDKVVARELCIRFEDLQLKAGPPGLYRCHLDGDFRLMPPGDTMADATSPMLVFLHGTASSGQGSFGKLWADNNSDGNTVRQQLKARYAERVFAFEHRSLSESPIINALALAESLPAKTELHLVSHSRGGLIGELICLSQCDNLTQLLTPQQLQTLFAADRTIAEQIGLSPLNDEDLAVRNDAYEKDREALAKLVEVLAAKQFRVTRFVRAACPARGTTLASGRLDRWLSVLDFLADKVLGSSLFADGLDFLLAVVKERTDPRTLPGLEAMMPGSALTRLLNNSGLITHADLSVIAGDIEGDSLWQKIKLIACDWFYGADHDLVVNTGSMFGGLRRLENGARFREDKGSEVNHFSYFRNRSSVNWLLTGLTHKDGEDGGFLPISTAPSAPPRWRDAVDRSRSSTQPRPLVVVLPGILGSHLMVRGKRVWLDYWALLCGGLEDIRMGAPDVAPDTLVDDFYGPLLEFLAHTHRVQIFAYDWRLSICEAAARLASSLETWVQQAEREQQPVHLVAHSMGGLVVRAMMADGGPGSSIWQRIARLPNSRLLMLGTPNLGSYEAVRWLTGFNPTQAKLSLLDFTRSTSEIVDLVRLYPGLLELLPFAAESPDFADPNLWLEIKKQLNATWKTAEATTLAQARNTWNRLRSARPVPQLMRYVAGCQPATVIGYQLSDSHSVCSGDRKRLEFLATTAGDGTVSWASGNLPGVPMWYVEDTAHDALCIQKSAFTAYLDLLQTGTTTRLPDTPPVSRGVAAGDGKDFILPASPSIDCIPSARSLRSFGFGSLPDVAPDDRPAVPTIEVSICHGDLSYARYPVMAGHYHGDTIISAERTLDQQLDGALARRLGLGLYPGRLGSHALFFNERANAKPAGAIIIGLGQVGELTPSLLEAGVRAALLDYALQVAQWPDERFGPAGSSRHASISCLLVGSGAGGVPVRDSLEAVLRGAIAANARLVDAELDNRVTLDRLEFLEIYEDMAITAAEGLRQILNAAEFANKLHWSAQEVEHGYAGQRRVLFDDTPEWWHRLEILEESNSNRDALRFIFATDRARAEETLATGQLALAESFIRQASNSANSNPETARTLFEMLLPLRLRELAPRQNDLVLLVDEHSARYPWELLENRWSDSERPPAVRSGLIRQLKTSEFRPRPAHAAKARALVVGNPNLDGWDKFADLPGARQEAQRVATLLGGRDWQVRDCIDEKTDAIIESLHRDAWRILHLAGHGVHQYVLQSPPASDQPLDHSAAPQPAAKPVSGMVIGRETFLTPGDIEQMRWVPELVFINCCHLGNTQPSESNARGELAANLGVQFIRMGVRAVISAGWAVDDRAALAFADTFYSHMLDGQPFGEAVRAAREDIWLRFPGVNTWGAYQCYGDPSYRLHQNGQERARLVAPYSAPAELVADLENLTQELKASGGGNDTDQTTAQRIQALLERIPEPQRKHWQQQAEVASALGFAWGEARYWPEAIAWLEKALCSSAGNCPLRVVEQLASFRSRQAAGDWLTLRRKGGSVTDSEGNTPGDMMKLALDDLEHLCSRAPTPERLNLLGSAYKRQALMLEQSGDRLAALDRMAAAYRESFELTGRGQLYSFCNWASAQLLALRLDASRTGDWQSTYEAECTQLRDALQQSDRLDPDFWDNAGPTSLDLTLLLARTGSLPTPIKELTGEYTTLADRIFDGYRDAIARGAPPHQRASARENLDWLITLLLTDAPALASALVRIREVIQ